MDVGSLFQLKWESIEKEASELFHELYGDDNDAFYSLKRTLQLRLSERSDELSTRDQVKVADPGWHQSNRWVGMMFYVDRFAGKIPDVEGRLDYLEELGINLVHLMPILKRREGENDGGYAVSDYSTIDPQFGSNEDLIRLISELHKRNSLVMMDMVLNHTADDHAWALKAKEGDPDYLDYFYHFSEKAEIEKFDPYMPEIFPATAPGSFSYIGELNKWLMTVFYRYQWDLNYRNPKVLNEIISALLTIANWGVDIIRLDAIIFIWKKHGTECQNLPEVHKIVRLLKLFTSCVAPGLLYLAEAITTKDEVAPYFGSAEKPQCDFAYNTALMSCLWDAMVRGNTRLLNQIYKAMPSIPGHTSWLNYIRCHDDISMAFTDEDLEKLGNDSDQYRRETAARMTGEYPGSFSKALLFMPDENDPNKRVASSLASLCGLEKARESGGGLELDLAFKRMEMLHAIILSVGGLPMLYYGDELAITNDYGFLEDEKLKLDTRWVSRPQIDWSRAQLREKPGTLENRAFTDLRNLIAIRKSCEPFSDKNDFKLILCGDDLFCFERGAMDKILCFFYFGQVQRKFSISTISGKYSGGTSLIREESYQPGQEILIEPYSFDWVKLKL